MSQVLPPLVLISLGGPEPSNVGPPGPAGPTGATGPTGPAGPENPLAMSGDVTGTTDANMVSKLQGWGLNIGPSLTSGNVIGWNDDDGYLEPLNLSSGDATFFPPEPFTISKLQGITLDVTNLTAGAVLTFNPVGPKLDLETVSHVPMAGDVSGHTDDNQVGAIQGKVVNLTSTYDGYVLTWSGTNNRLELDAPSAGVSGSNVFVYRDSEPSPSGNVYATFMDAYNAAIATGAPATIVIDDSITIGNIPLNSGDFDLHQITLSGVNNPFGTPFIVNKGNTFNEGLFRVTNGLNLLWQGGGDGPALGTITGNSFSLTVDNYCLVANQATNFPMFDLTNFTGQDVNVFVDNGANISSGGNTAGVFGLGSTGSYNFNLYIGEQALVDNFLVSSGNNTSFNQEVAVGAQNLVISYPNYTGSFDVTYSGSAAFLQPFRVTGSLPSPGSIPANITAGQMAFFGGKPYWFDGSTWITYSALFQSGFIYSNVTSPITNPNTGDTVPLVIVSSGVNSTYLTNGGPHDYVLSFFNGTPGNVAFKLVASLGSLYDGNFTYQWWDNTNNVGLGNVAGNVGGGPSLDAVAIVPYNYSNTFINVSLKLTFVSGTTFIGEATAGGFIGPWATLETIGIPA